MPTLDWIGKNKVISHHRDVPYHILERKYSFDENGQMAENNGSDNMIIHADNLVALKSLLPKYEGKIKCIYIDPPYNTGNEGWVYNDNVNDPKISKWLGDVVGKEGEDLSRHDKWLCMMYPRLRLLQKLLSEDGAIYISIGDDEVSSLRFICNEIFGETNFVDTIIWQKIYTIKNSAKYFSGMHDYIVIYAKNKVSYHRNLFPRTEELDNTYTNPDNDPRGPWTTNAVQARNYNGNGQYVIKAPSGKTYTPPAGTYWRVSEESFYELDKDNRIWWGQDGTSVPRIKRFLSEAKQGVVPTTFWSYQDAGQNADAKLEVRSIFGGDGSIFNTPKPTKLIERILQIGTDSDSVILDSFAGSGTTAHAVLNANKADGGKRKFILIEMEDYADSITAERVRRVINGYSTDKKAIPGTGGSFSYYELGSRMFLEDGNLNPEMDLREIREYIWHMETRENYPELSGSEQYLLGMNNGIAVYFLYEKDQATTLDKTFLSTVRTRADHYVIYADTCLISDEKLMRLNITFKKIPRDIAKL